MKNSLWSISKILLLFSLLFITLSILASCSDTHRQSAVQRKAQQRIDQIIAQYAPMIVGIKIQDMSNGEIIFERNSDKAFNPASNLKLFTATAALIYLGPNYRYETILLADAKDVKDGVINGNLYLKFSGDPSLKDEHLNEIFAEMHKQGIKKLIGNLYLDASAYDNTYYGPGWMLEDLNFSFAAPISAIILNKNQIEYMLTPTLANNTAKLQPINEQLYNEKIIQVINTVITSDKLPSSINLAVDEDNIISISGYVTSNDKAKKLAVAIKNPSLYAKKLLKQVIQNNKIELNGKILEGTTKSSLQILVSHSSEPLRFLIDDMLKNSDNVISNSILKTLGFQFFKQPGSWENGIKAVQATLSQNAYINFDKSVLVDGDGQSRYDLVTPDQISQLLNFAYHNFAINPELISALPIAGSDGTLTNRLNDEKILVRAKTGSMTGIDSLCGYIENSTHHIWSFVILINNYTGSNEVVNKFEDEICRVLSSISY
jgi:serine-type D-Ala-D-Ala carboxypeptidase/endopeptidase (penicillin-binding protein 4)